MGGLVLRAGLRRRWRSWLALAALTALASGLVLAAAEAGRRTNEAFPSFLAAHGFDAALYTGQPAPQLARYHEITKVTAMISPDTGEPVCACAHPINPEDFGIIFVPSGQGVLSKLVSGHEPDPGAPDQVLASYTLQRDYGFHLGTIVRVPLYAARQKAAYNNATGALPKPRGPVVFLRVVGFEATEFEFPSGTTPSYDLYVTAAFARTVMPRSAFGYSYALRLRHGAAGIADMTAQASAQGVEISNYDAVVNSVESAIHPQAVGWSALACLAAVVALAVVAQAMARQSVVESDDYPTMVALGADRRQLAAVGLARNLIVAVVGAAGAVVIAFVLSPVAPLGEARVAETSSGVRFDPVVLPLGALATVIGVFALGAWPVIKATRTRAPPRRHL